MAGTFLVHLETFTVQKVLAMPYYYKYRVCKSFSQREAKYNVFSNQAEIYLDSHNHVHTYV